MRCPPLLSSASSALPVVVFSMLALLEGRATADVKLPAVFGDHMVLQRESKAAVWGSAAPNEELRVIGSWSKDEVRCVADAQGRWRTTLATPAAGGPFTLRVQGRASSVEFTDVLVGEVWLCGGQSNMEMPLAAVDGYSGVAGADLELANADHPHIRFLDVINTFAARPQSDCRGQWTTCTRETLAHFSATGWFFGKQLEHELGVPIGLVSTNWGGTEAQVWTSEEGLRALGAYERPLAEFDKLREHMEQFTPAQLDTERKQAFIDWWRDLEKRDPGSTAAMPWSAAAFDDSSWKSMPVPGLWKDELARFDGVMWYRRSVTIPPEWAGKQLVLDLGAIDDMDTTWFDGQRAGGMEGVGYWSTPRHYRIQPALATAGVHHIAVRVVDTGGLGGFSGKPEEHALHPLDPKVGGAPIALAGDWKFALGAKLSDLNPFPAPAAIWEHTPTALYNAMVAPLEPFAIRGAIWYQGESNRSDALGYRKLFPAMIQDWRKGFAQGDFPFYFVQLAPFRYGPDQGETALLREAQFATLALPSTGMAVTMDIGNPDDIHPKDKRSVGERLALWALAKTYGKSALEFSGPLYKSFTVEGQSIRVRFDHASGLRTSAPSGLFEIAGADKLFVRAEARVDGDTLVVTSTAVAAPLAVRYAWCDACAGTLFNAANLPASPFRTDAW